MSLLFNWRRSSVGGDADLLFSFLTGLDRQRTLSVAEAEAKREVSKNCEILRQIEDKL